MLLLIYVFFQTNLLCQNIQHYYEALLNNHSFVYNYIMDKELNQDSSKLILDLEIKNELPKLENKNNIKIV